MKVPRVNLAGKLNQHFLAIFAVDDVDQHGADLAEIPDTVMMRVFDGELGGQRYVREIEQCLHLVHGVLDDHLVRVGGYFDRRLDDGRIGGDFVVRHDAGRHSPLDRPPGANGKAK